MELNHLKYFYAVAKNGGFTSASEQLRIQQPTISKMVRALEQHLGMTLLERHKKGVRLTRAGVDVFSTCEEIFNKVEEIRSLSDLGKSECEGKLSFGAPGSVSSYLVPPVLREFLSEHPKVQPSIHTGTSTLITNEIYDGRIEFGLFFEAREKSDFQVTELMEIPFRLVASTDRTKDSKPDSALSFIIARKTDYTKTTPFPVLEMLNKNKVKVETFISSNNLESQKGLVREGLGVALLPAFMVEKEIEDGTFTVLYPKKKFSYSLKLITRKGKVLSRDATVFLEIFKKHASQSLRSSILSGLEQD
jgi:DNA-binding transcriptional LysR family regulator